MRHRPRRRWVCGKSYGLSSILLFLSSLLHVLRVILVRPSLVIKSFSLYTINSSPGLPLTVDVTLNLLPARLSTQWNRVAPNERRWDRLLRLDGLGIRNWVSPLNTFSNTLLKCVTAGNLELPNWIRFEYRIENSRTTSLLPNGINRGSIRLRWVVNTNTLQYPIHNQTLG